MKSSIIKGSVIALNAAVIIARIKQDNVAALYAVIFVPAG